MGGSGSGSQGPGKAVPPNEPVKRLSLHEYYLTIPGVREAEDKRRQKEAKERREREDKWKEDHQAAIRRGEERERARIDRLNQASAKYGTKIAQHARHLYETQPKAWSKHATRGPYGPGTNKCNLFVCEVSNGTGSIIPTDFTQGKYPPLAKHWGDPAVVIPGWEIVENPRPGDVAAVSNMGPIPGGSRIDALDVSGHVAIVVENNKTISHSSIEDKLVENEWGFRPQQEGQVVFRRYVGP